MKPTVVLHMNMPGTTRQTAPKLERKETISAFLRRTEWAKRNRKTGWQFACGLPTICVVNSKPVLQKDWARKKIGENDLVVFYSKPRGGGGGKGKSLIGLIAIIGLSLIAPGIGTSLAGYAGLGAVSIFNVSAGQLIGAALVVGGSLLINTLIAPKPGGQNNQANIDPLYTAQIAGNQARPFEPRSVQYGRIKTFPDFAASTWSEYEGNDQYLNILLSLGEGKHELEALYVDDTILWTEADGFNTAFTDVEFEQYNPGEDVDLFPQNVVQASEVSGQTLPDPDDDLINEGWIGGFIANAAGTEANALAVDLVFPQGCFRVNSEGAFSSANATVQAEIRTVNSAGAATGPWVTLFTKTYTFNKQSPIRITEKYDVGPNRYEVRVRRTDSPLETGGSNEVAWASLRAFIEGPSSYPVSTIAVRIKGTAQLSELSSRRIGVLSTRIIRVWDDYLQQLVEAPSRNPIWAFFDAATDTEYGAGRPASKIDIAEVIAQAEAADTRGDHFDYVFTSATRAVEAFDTILKVARCRHRWAGDKLTLVRDEWKGGSGMLLSDRETIRGSVRMEFALNDEESSDCVILEYLDEQTWRAAEVQYPPDSNVPPLFFAQNPARIRVDGIVNRDHAFREAAFFYRQAQYRRCQVILDTEHDGRLLSFGAPVLLQSDLPQEWGSAGAILERDGLNLTLDIAPRWESGPQHFIEVRTARGRRFGPVKITQGYTINEAVLDAVDLAIVEAQGMTLDQALARQDGADDPTFVIGTASKLSRPAIVISGKPNKERVSVTLTIDDIRVHDTDLGTTPPAPTVPTLPQDQRAPIITFAQANFRQGQLEPVLDVMWWPAPGALRYVVEISYDSGSSWQPFYDGVALQHSAVVDLSAIRVRVQAIGIRPGPFFIINVEPPEISFPPAVISPDSLQPGLRDWILNQLKDRTESLFKAQQKLAAVVARQDSDNALQRMESQIQLQRTLGQAQATATQLISVAVGPGSAIAQALTELVALIDDVEASLTVRWVAAVTPDGALSAYEVIATAENAKGGMKIVSFDDGLGGAIAQMWIDADRFYVGKEGLSGYTPIFIVDASSPAQVIFNADLIANGTITAEKLNVIDLSSVSANIGVITAGLLKSADNKVVFDLDAGSLTISD